MPSELSHSLDSPGIVWRLLPGRQSRLLFLLVFVGIALTAGAASYFALHYSEEPARERLRAGLEQAEAQAVNAIRRETERTVFDATADLFVLRRMVERHLASEIDERYLGAAVLDFIGHKRTYDRMRYIDIDGREYLRVDQERDGPQLRTGSQLQDKSERPYFQEAKDLARNTVLITPLDANREFGSVELPLVPVFRIMTPVAGSDGRTAGIVVINYRAKHLLESIESIGAAAIGHPMVVNRAGRDALAVFRERTAEKLAGRHEDGLFPDTYPDPWYQMLTRTQGSVADGLGGIMTFDRVTPARMDPNGMFPASVRWLLPRDLRIDDGGGWLVISHIDASTLQSIVALGLNRSAVAERLYFLLIGLVSWMLALLFSNLYSESRAMRALAIRDPLTGLINRAEFERRVAAAMAHAQRHDRMLAVLYIDLDYLKETNDSLGHAAGDAMLMETARILRRCTRRSDEVARLGGDEFGIALRETGSHENTQKVVQFVRDQLAASVTWSGHAIPLAGSVGGATYPQDGLSVEELTATADEAMYRDKERRHRRRESSKLESASPSGDAARI